MLKVQEIKELIRALDQSSVDELKYEVNGTKIKLKKNQSVSQTVEKVASSVETPRSTPTIQQQVEPAQIAQPNVIKEEKKQEEAAKTHTINSPMVGTFYAASSPDADPYVSAGDNVKDDSIVCIVEAMKLMNEIEAEVNGKIVEVLAENGELVEYGQPLFVVERS